MFEEIAPPNSSSGLGSAVVLRKRKSHYHYHYAVLHTVVRSTTHYQCAWNIKALFRVVHGGWVVLRCGRSPQFTHCVRRMVVCVPGVPLTALCGPCGRCRRKGEDEDGGLLWSLVSGGRA